MNITDTIPARTVEDGDQVVIDGDPLEDVIVFDGETLIISGYSHNEGDRVSLVVDPDTLVDLWSI